ncbi:uncharacterized protein LOC121897345 [Scomber scombrus]|uniref:Uncharacterized protein LOC121897345 n=1 Tax=Scomber scombrus TaxID=13677 RepID=A0AAV1MWS1_SCOSC
MEQDCIAGLYQSLGMPVGAEFSTEDVSLLFRKMFHIPSSTDETHVAMKKIAGADNSWSCVGGNVLYVLLEMEREREKKEKLYWDLQLLNVGSLNPLNVMDSLEIIDPHVLNCLHQSTDPNTFKKAHNSDLGSAQSCTFDTDNTQAGQEEPETNVSTHQVGNSQSSESKNVLQRSSGSPAILGEMAVLQLLVLTHEQERQHLVQLVHGISLEELQWPGCTVPPNKEDSQKQASLRNVCIKRLRQIHARLQTHSNAQIILEQTYSQLQPQPQMHEHIGTLTEWSQHQLEDCALLFLTHLLELQEVQATALLPALMDKSTQHLQALQDECESQLQSKHYTNLHKLLISDATFTSGSILNPNTNMTQSSSKEQITAESCCREPVDAQNISAESYDTLTVVSVRRASRELKGVQTEDGTNAHDVCTECGAAMEDLPYLEILCVSDTTSNTPEVFAAEGGAQDEEEASATKSPQSCEKQGSLIAVAWSKPPEDDTNNEAEAADRKTAQSQDGKSSLKTRDIHSTAEQTQCEETAAQSHNEELKPTPFQSGSTGHPDTQSVDQQCSVEQLTLEERPMPTLQMEQPHLLVDSPDIEEHASDLCFGVSNEISNSSREVVEVEMCPIASKSQLWELRGPETAHPEDQKYISQATVDCSLAERKAMRESALMERERAREPVSAMERERTMRNLVDMQRKVEQRQQRDRERQLLRVQERLSIIQNKKAEEDLLGLKHGDRLRHLTHDLPQDDKKQQKTVVRERLEQLRRERSYVMQSKRDRLCI